MDPLGADPTPADAAAGGTDAPLYQRVEQQIPKLAREMVSRFVAEVPFYRRLPKEQVEGEILAITEDNLRIFFRTLREGRPPTEEELAEPRLSAARRAEERVPLDSVLAAYHVGGRLGWEALVGAAGPEDTTALIAAGSRVLGYVQAVSAAVAAAYLDEQQLITGEEREASRELAVALLSGAPADALANRLGIRLPPAYVVLALSIGPHPDERDTGVAGTVAGRRKLRRLQDAVRKLAGEPLLGLVEASGGSLLVADTEPTEERSARLAELVEAMTTAAGAEVHAGAAVGDRLSLSGVAEQAAEVLRLVRQLDRPPGCYWLGDVLLEYQLSRTSAAVPLLMSLLTPLERNPDLLRTLEAYLDHDLDRRTTASLLHVHPNTLDYRLRRIVELTGLDLASTAGLQLLGAAVAARRVVS